MSISAINLLRQFTVLSCTVTLTFSYSLLLAPILHPLARSAVYHYDVCSFIFFCVLNLPMFFCAYNYFWLDRISFLRPLPISSQEKG